MDIILFSPGTRRFWWTKELLNEMVDNMIEIKGNS